MPPKSVRVTYGQVTAALTAATTAISGSIALSESIPKKTSAEAFDGDVIFIADSADNHPSAITWGIQNNKIVIIPKIPRSENNEPLSNAQEERRRRVLQAQVIIAAIEAIEAENTLSPEQVIILRYYVQEIESKGEAEFSDRITESLIYIPQARIKSIKDKLEIIETSEELTASSAAAALFVVAPATSALGVLSPLAAPDAVPFTRTLNRLASYVEPTNGKLADLNTAIENDLAKLSQAELEFAKFSQKQFSKVQDADAVDRADKLDLSYSQNNSDEPKKVSSATPAHLIAQFIDTALDIQALSFSKTETSGEAKSFTKKCSENTELDAKTQQALGILSIVYKTDVELMDDTEQQALINYNNAVDDNIRNIRPEAVFLSAPDVAQAVYYTLDRDVHKIPVVRKALMDLLSEIPMPGADSKITNEQQLRAIFTSLEAAWLDPKVDTDLKVKILLVLRSLIQIAKRVYGLPTETFGFAAEASKQYLAPKVENSLNTGIVECIRLFFDTSRMYQPNSLDNIEIENAEGLANALSFALSAAGFTRQPEADKAIAAAAKPREGTRTVTTASTASLPMASPTIGDSAAALASNAALSASASSSRITSFSSSDALASSAALSTSASSSEIKRSLSSVSLGATHKSKTGQAVVTLWEFCENLASTLLLDKGSILDNIKVRSFSEKKNLINILKKETPPEKIEDRRFSEQIKDMNESIRIAVLITLKKKRKDQFESKKPELLDVFKGNQNALHIINILSHKKADIPKAILSPEYTNETFLDDLKEVNAGLNAILLGKRKQTKSLETIAATSQSPMVASAEPIPAVVSSPAPSMPAPMAAVLVTTPPATPAPSATQVSNQDKLFKTLQMYVDNIQTIKGDKNSIWKEFKELLIKHFANDPAMSEIAKDINTNNGITCSALADDSNFLTVEQNAVDTMRLTAMFMVRKEREASKTETDTSSWDGQSGRAKAFKLWLYDSTRGTLPGSLKVSDIKCGNDIFLEIFNNAAAPYKKSTQATEAATGSSLADASAHSAVPFGPNVLVFASAVPPVSESMPAITVSVSGSSQPKSKDPAALPTPPTTQVVLTLSN